MTHNTGSTSKEQSYNELLLLYNNYKTIKIKQKLKFVYITPHYKMPSIKKQSIPVKEIDSS